jgi:hypothetical protein
LEAARRLSQDRDWNFVLAQSQIAAVDGTKGPYSLPVDFDGPPLERRLTKYFAYDGADTDPAIADGTFNRRFEVYIDRSSGVPLLFFWLNPGSRSLTLTYRKNLLTIADLASWPEAIDVKACLKNKASAILCMKTPELQAMASNFDGLAEKQKIQLWRDVRRKSSRVDNRTPQDVFGQGLYQNHAGEYL